MFTAIQIFLLAVVIFEISRVCLRLKEGVITTRMAFFWFLIWVAALVGIALPATTTKIAEFFGVGRGVDIIVYISLALLFYLVFRIYVMIEDLRHQITYIIREIALSGSSKIRKNPKRSKK